MSITSRALAFASLWFDAATVHRVFEPLIADVQRECSEAPSSRRYWTLMRGMTAFATTIAVLGPGRLLLTPIPGTTLRIVARRMATFRAVACCLLAIPLWLSLSATPFERRMLLLSYMLPLLFGFAFSLVSAFIIDSVRLGPRVSHSERLAAAQLASAAAIFVFIFSGWVTPQFREMVRIETVGSLPDSARGVHELSTLELVLDPTSAAAYEPYTGGRDRGTRIRAELHERAYAVVLPLLLVWLRWKALEVPKRDWLPLPASAASVLSGVMTGALYLGM